MAIVENDGILVMGMDDEYNRKHFSGYSRDGTLLGTSPIPDSLSVVGTGALIRECPAGGAWFFFNIGGNPLYHIAPSGEFGKHITIQPSRNTQGCIVNGHLYCEDQNTILDIDLATGQSSIFKDLSSERRIMALLAPGIREGFAVAVWNQNLRQQECIHYSTNGAELKKTILPGMAVDIQIPIAVDDSIFYFDRYFYRLNTQGGYTCGAMPILQQYYSLHVRSDGTVAAIRGGSSEEPGKVRCYRLMK